MTYKPNDASIATEWYDNESTYYDSRNDGGTKLPCVVLPHSCNEWVIGGKDEVKQMIADLTVLLEKL